MIKQQKATPWAGRMNEEGSFTKAQGSGKPLPGRDWGPGVVSLVETWSTEVTQHLPKRCQGRSGEGRNPPSIFPVVPPIG